MSDSVYARLGVRPVINAMGTYTLLGGSLMPAEVTAAMADAARHFVNMTDLQEKAGQRIADLLGVPAAMITAGAASAITVATAACITRVDCLALEHLPEVAGPAPEIVLQRSHKSGYEAQMRLTGARLVWVETLADLDAAINDRTAMLFYLNCSEPSGRIPRDVWLRAAKKRGVPTLLDAAADVPPVSHLSDFVHEGFDLVAISGGKALRGPQATGLLLGRDDLVAAARRAISPHEGIGRGMKVGKEEIIGLLAAVERYLMLDHEAELREWERRTTELISRIATIPGLHVRRDIPPIANHTPHVIVSWSMSTCALTAEEISQCLLKGDPPIALLVEGDRAIRIAVWTLQDGEHELVAGRLRAVFS